MIKIINIRSHEQLKLGVPIMFEDDTFIDECSFDNECDVFQIGGICTEKNCEHCVNHSGFCPVDRKEVK